MNKFNIITFKSIGTLIILAIVSTTVWPVLFSYKGNFLYGELFVATPVLLIYALMILWIWHPKGAAAI